MVNQPKWKPTRNNTLQPQHLKVPAITTLLEHFQLAKEVHSVGRSAGGNLGHGDALQVGWFSHIAVVKRLKLELHNFLARCRVMPTLLPWCSGKCPRSHGSLSATPALVGFHVPQSNQGKNQLKLKRREESVKVRTTKKQHAWPRLEIGSQLGNIQSQRSNCFT